MFRNFISKVVAPVVVALILAVMFFAQPAKAQAASHIFVGDAFISCGSQMVGPDNDANTGQVLEIQACPTAPVIGKVYSIQWLPYSVANRKAAVNDLLLNGCGNPEGCGSVRLYTMTANGTSNMVVNEPYPMSPAITVTVSPGATNNQKIFNVTVSDVGLWNHSLAFGDGPESVFGFDQAASSFSVPHDYDWKGGTFTVTLTATLLDGSTITKTIVVKIPHP
jgi:hypothetical protein